jgi:4-hydroxy-tetrahydrodipicolinate reductase
LREGEVVGEHQVRLLGPGETLELSHSAGDRDIFALGALHAASLLAGRGAGQYRLGELLLGSRD